MVNREEMLIGCMNNITSKLTETVTVDAFEDEDGVTTILVTDSEDENSKIIWTGKFAELMLNEISALYDSGFYDEAENNESEEES